MASTADRGSPSGRPGAADGGGAATSGGATDGAASATGGRATAASFLGEAAEQLTRLVGADRASILLLEGRHLHHAASVRLPAEYVRAIDRLEIGPEADCCGAAAYAGRTQITTDTETDPRWERVRPLTRAVGLRSCWSVPLKLPDGNVLGSFAVYFDRPSLPTPEQRQLAEAYASIVALGLDNVRRNERLAASYEAAVLALTSALDVRDDYTGSHSTATSRLVREICVRLGLDEHETEIAARVAALHDVGKLGVPTEILTSSQPLTPEQARVMRDHPVIGEQILRQIPGMEEIAKAVRHEHERWDGSGYPDGIAGERIPLASRIVFACDAYHAMVSDRPYRSGMDQSAAVSELRENAGSQFDPEVVAALLDVLGDKSTVFGCSPSEVEERNRREALERLAAEIGAEDVFVFRKVARDTYSHLAGAGQGDGWAGNIELRPGEPGSLPRVAVGSAQCFAHAEPARIIGPYYARSAVVVPCRHDVIVVFGSSTDSLRGADEAEMTRFAERAAEMVDHVPAAKRLADELEVLDAVRAVTTVNATGVEAGLVEIAERAAIALSCDFAAVIVDRQAPTARFGWHQAGWVAGNDPAAARDMLAELAAAVRAADRPLLIQDTAQPGVAVPRGFGAEDGAASVHGVPINDVAVLVAAHARPSPRGFTSLCQRVIRSLADGAELVIRRSLAQEQLSRENAKLERRASTDPLTGVNNRGGWDESLAHAQLELARGETELAVAAFDLDGLKAVNDSRGHQAGDDLLRAFASILAATARSHDFVARIGGDEFAVLLRNCDGPGAVAWCERAIAAIEDHNAAGADPQIEVSWGCAAVSEAGGIAAAIAEADRGLYGDKNS